MVTTFTDKWKDLNHPIVVIKDGISYHPIPILAGFLDYNEDNVDELLRPPEAYGWDNEFAYAFAWANNYDKITLIELDFSRYGYLPRWFPLTDIEDKPITPQAQVDPFLSLLNIAYGGFPDNPLDIPMFNLAQAMIDLYDNYWEYAQITEEY